MRVRLTLSQRLFIVSAYCMGPGMTEHYFNALEHKIDLLLARVEQLELENSTLREQDTRLREERAQLIQLNDQTRSKVEGMIQRLKALEQNS
ncbi:cell division protein ZapB [Marinobacterium sp. MBR-111]|jgi:cell division protein ZapB|uniref:Cell division protein ZapB n=2 Tax=Oceanospirillaceae TaxID=135620 RepID=A0A1H4DZA8_9GAMM|nr:cell division protein ZapB [Marinobacterium iners DSM 11526]